MDVPAFVSQLRGPHTVHDEYKDDKTLLNPQDYDAAANMGHMQTMINANLGDVQAKVALRDRFKDGREVHQDYQAAMDWYCKAAEQGHPHAQSNIGLLYDQGYGSVLQDHAKAFEWFLKDAVQGYGDAQVKASQAPRKTTLWRWSGRSRQPRMDTQEPNTTWGTVYEKGQGIPQSDSRSFE